MSDLTCQPETTDQPGIFRCPVCGLQNPRPINKPFGAKCGEQAEMKRLQEEAARRLADETGDLTILDKTVHYATALYRWTASGFKTRTDEEIAAIYTEHCLLCEERDPEADACKVCGCCVQTEGMAIRRKLKMKTETCPIGKW